MKLKDLRKRTKLSQDQLAKLSGSNQVTISLLETGKVTPNSDTRMKLEKALGQRINWLDGKGFARFHNQDFSELEERFRKVLYDVNFLQEQDRIDFLAIAQTYLSEIQKGLNA